MCRRITVKVRVFRHRSTYTSDDNKMNIDQLGVKKKKKNFRIVDVDLSVYLMHTHARVRAHIQAMKRMKLFFYRLL